MNKPFARRFLRTIGAFVLFIFWSLAGQAAQKTIHLRNKTIVTESTGKSSAHQNEASLSGLFLVQFTGPVQSEWRKDLQKSGVHLLRFVPDDAFVARFKNVHPSELGAYSFVQAFEPYGAEYKIYSSLRANVAHAPVPESMRVSILLAPDSTPQDLAQLRRTLRKLERESAMRFGNILQGVVTPEQLTVLGESPSVLWIEPAPKIKLFDEISSKVTAGDDGDTGTPSVSQQLGFDGTGVKVAVADSGLQEGDTATMHPDLAGRVDAFFHYGTLTDAADEHSHGTHVTGIIAGNAATGETDDNGYRYGLGVAPGAYVIAQRIFDGDGGYEAPPTFEVLTHDAVRAGAVIGSNSWGDDTQGRYDLSAAEFDELVRDADSGTAGDQQYILEFSAGNAGPGERTIGSPAVAKNVIASGAVENNRFDLFIYDSGQEVMADFSSRGPCEDGRIKPDVVAPGTWIASLRSSLANDDNAWAPISENYLYQGGTSQSGPHVSGAAAVLVQYYRQTVTNVVPSPALVKATLINSAVALDDGEFFQPVPNNDAGWGRVDLTEIIGSPRTYQFVDQTERLTNNQVFEKRVLVASPNEPLKITLAYSDVPGFAAAIPALVNDLDLEVIAPDGSSYHGNQFEEGESVPGATSYDNINNVEAVHISSPARGEYLVRVRARSVVEDARRDTPLVDDQDFALVISADIPPPGVGVLFFDKQSYSAPGTIKLKLVDLNLAGQPSAAVHVWSSTEPSGENFLLTASGSTGSFTGNVATATGSATVDGKLQIAHNADIFASYQDASPAGLRQAAARADLLPPIISNIFVTNRFGRTVVSWQTDEPSTSITRLGTNSSLSLSITNSALTTGHEVIFDNLTAGTNYFFKVASIDEAGNGATNDDNGKLFQFIAQPAATILLVDAYVPVVDDPSPVIPQSSYTDALNQIGLSFDVWPVSQFGSPGTNDLRPFHIVIWRINDSLFGSDSLSPAQQTVLGSYFTNGGSIFLSSMELLSRMGTNSSSLSFRSNILHVASFAEDAGISAVDGIDNDPITSGVNLDIDYSQYDNYFLDLLGQSPDVADTLTITTNSSPIFFDGSSDVAGVRYPKVGQDSLGRVVFLPFPLDAISATEPDPNNRANFLRNAVSFLLPGANGLGTIVLDRSTYAIPSLVTIEVVDSDLKGTGQTSATVFSDTAPGGQSVTLNETPRLGLFRGFVTLVAQTNSFQVGELRVKGGDEIRAEYVDLSSSGTAQVVATVDSVPATITNVSIAPEYEEIVVNWTTSKPTDALVQFGESTFPGRTAYRSTFKTSHSLTLTGLQPDRPYYLQFTSRDAAGNATIDDNGGNFYLTRTLKPLASLNDNLENKPSSWTVLDGEPSTTTWKLGQPNNGMESQAHSPTNAWGSNLDGKFIDLGDTTLASPAIDLTSGDQAMLRFWHSYDFTEQSDSDIYEMGQVYVSTNNGNAWSLIAEYNDSSFGWEEAQINLAPYLGHIVRIGFYYGFFSLGTGNHPGWLIDDISVSVTSNPQFAFRSVSYTNNQTLLRLVAPSGTNYVIEASTNFVNWIPLKTNVGTSAEINFIDTESANFKMRFYRLKTVPGISQFEFRSVNFTNNQAVLTLVAPSGTSYVIEGSSNLVNWAPLQTNTGTSAEAVFTDTQSANFKTRFYRLKK